MSFNSIVNGLDNVRVRSASNSFFVNQVETRVLNGFNLLIEAWNIIVSLGETLRDFVGTLARTALWLPRQIFNWSGLENLNNALPSCTDFRNSAVKTIQLGVGLLSTVALGVVINPNWNYSVHVSIGIVPAQRPAAAAVN